MAIERAFQDIKDRVDIVDFIEQETGLTAERVGTDAHRLNPFEKRFLLTSSWVRYLGSSLI